MTLLRAAVLLLALGLGLLIIWASSFASDLHGGLFDQFGVLWVMPWGKIALGDLYLGFFLFGTIIFLTERRWWVGLLWAAPILILGNVWSAVWLALRLPRLAKQLSRPDWPSS